MVWATTSAGDARAITSAKARFLPGACIDGHRTDGRTVPWDWDAFAGIAGTRASTTKPHHQGLRAGWAT
jgi:hypothetical protein